MSNRGNCEKCKWYLKDKKYCKFYKSSITYVGLCGSGHYGESSKIYIEDEDNNPSFDNVVNTYENGGDYE